MQPKTIKSKKNNGCGTAPGNLVYKVILSGPTVFGGWCWVDGGGG
jgi:hypothetical protein